MLIRVLVISNPVYSLKVTNMQKLSVTLRRAFIILKLFEWFPSWNCSLQKMAEAGAKWKVPWNKANYIHGPYTPSHTQFPFPTLFSISNDNIKIFFIPSYQNVTVGSFHWMAPRMGILFKI